MSFADKSLQKRLTSEFIAVTANTQELQWQKSPTQKWFLDLVKRTMARGVSSRNGSKLSGQRPGRSSLDLNRQMAQTNDPQGMYIFGADGTPYAFCNDHGPEDIHKMLDIGLKRFRENPPKKTTITEEDIATPFGVRPPEDAKVLQVYARIPFPPKNTTFLNKGVGIDYCWIYSDEMKAIAEMAAKGEKFDMPLTVSRRLARFHLTDNVRGTPDIWWSKSVRSLQMTATPTGTGQLEIGGGFTLRSQTGKMGYKGTFEGTVTFDPESGEWGKVRLMADGKAYGAGKYTPNPPKNSYRLLIGFLDTDDENSRIIPPEGVAIYAGDRKYRAAE